MLSAVCSPNHSCITSWHLLAAPSTIYSSARSTTRRTLFSKRKKRNLHKHLLRKKNCCRCQMLTQSVSTSTIIGKKLYCWKHKNNAVLDLISSEKAYFRFRFIHSWDQFARKQHTPFWSKLLVLVNQLYRIYTISCANIYRNICIEQILSLIE